jgi:hypothetical protein
MVMRAGVHIDMHLLDLLVPHYINCFLCALEIKFKLSVLLIKFHALWERSQ